MYKTNSTFVSTRPRFNKPATKQYKLLERIKYIAFIITVLAMGWVTVVLLLSVFAPIS